MDYDENDFQCQNFHLVGEDNNKFPPSLHPFPLPKYDLDENLQVHVGFANFIETQGLEGNNWIENFSPGGSVIEFSSSAAESCSISRRNNVWSEATSSESVEMLLKSLGEDEMIDQKAITKEVDVHNELNDMDGHKDTSLKQIDSGNSKMLDMIQINQAVPPDKCQNILSGLVGDTLEVEPQIEGMLQTSIDDKCGTDMKISTSEGKLSADQKVITDECIMENRIVASSDNVIRDSSVIADAIQEEGQNVNPMQIAFVKRHGCFSSPLAAEIAECTCHDEHSSLSICNLVTSPEMLNSRTPLKQLKECSKIDTIDNKGILSDETQKESCCVRDSEMIDQTSQSVTVPSGLCSVKDSSLLELAVLPLNERCNDTGISEDPDGLFEAIANQTKALVKGTQTSEGGLLLTVERPLMEVEVDSEKESTEISNQVAQTFHLTEEQVTNARHTGAEQLRNIDATLAGNTQSIESVDKVESKEEQELDGLLELNEEKQVPGVQLTKNNNSDVETISIVEVNSSIAIRCEMEIDETNNGHDGFIQLNCTPRNSDFIGIAEYAEDEVAKDIKKKSKVELNIQKNDTLVECMSPQDAVTPYAVCSKSSEKCDADTLVVEPHEVCIASEATLSAKEISMPFANLTRVNNDALIVTKENEGAPSTEQRTAITANKGGPLPVKFVQSEPVVADMPTLDGDDEQPAQEFPASVLEKKVAESSESKILRIDLDSQVSRESIGMSHPVLMDCSSATVQTGTVIEIVAINDSENFHQSEHDNAMAMDIVERQQEELGTGSPKSHSIHLDEKEIQISGVSSLPVSKDITDAEVSSAPVTQANPCEHGPAPSSEAEPSAGLSSSRVDVCADVACQDKLQSFLEHPAMDEHDIHMEEDLVSHASPVKENDGVDASGAFPQEDMGTTLITSVVADMPTLDGDDEQPAQEFPARVLEKKAAESSESKILRIDLDSQVSRESIGMSHPVLMDCSSATVQTGTVVEIVAINDSENFHQSEHDNAMVMDIVERQQEELGTGSPKSHSIHLDEKEIQISGVSSLPVSKDITAAEVSSAPVTQANPCEHGPAPSSEAEPSAGLSSSRVDVCADVACQDKLQSFLEHPAMDEHDIQMEEDLVSHASPVKENDGVDASGAFPREDMGTTLITSGNCTSNSLESAVTRSNAESHMVEAESTNQNLFDQTCGSPTIISCSKGSQGQMHQEGNTGQQDLVDPVSDDPTVETSDTRMNNDKVGCSGLNLKEDGSTEVDKSFTFEVGSVPDLSRKDTDKESTSFSSKQTSELPQMLEKIPDELLQESKEDELNGISKKTPDERNTGHVSGHSKDALSTSQTEVSKQTTFPKQTPETGLDPCGTSAASTGTIGGSRDLEETQYYHCSPTVMASTDLSSSVPAVALFYQPFTDLQQIQLRAQIFVYGSLIQGIPPDEACMISAFGEADGSRSLWEALWHLSAERYQNQKSPFSSCETPIHSYPGVQGTGAGLQSKALGTSARSACKTSSLPPWNTSACDSTHSSIPRVTHLDFNQALSPVHAHQSSQIRQYAGNSPWQTSHPGPWVIQSSTHDTTAQFSTLSVAETVQVTPGRDSSVPSSVGMQFVSPHGLLPATGAINISPAPVVKIEAQKKATTPVNSKSATGKMLRKRKKGAPPEELLSNNLASQPLVETPAAASLSKHLLASSLLPKPANPPNKVTSNGLVSATTHIVSPTHYQILSGDSEHKAIFSEETRTKVELAKLHAEDAAAIAASAVRHSQGIWTQLAIQRKTGLISEIDEKLASAAAAVAAAASVAKAAAAAARVASDAALQAKMMADEAVSSVKSGNLSHISESGLLDMGNNLIRLTPGSILKGKDKVHGSSTIISAAREAARRRVEAASAATKRAQNLDAIVKAAELAAEAVSQAGTIITMGEPLPFTLNDMVEAGPEGHWRIRRSITSGHAKTNGLHNEKHMGLDNTGSSDKSVEQFQAEPANNRIPHNSSEKEITVSSSKQPILLEERCLGNESNTGSAVPADENERDHSTINHNEFNIQEGSLVEVAMDDGETRGIWFSANVLEVKDGKAYVCYTDLLSNEGNGKLKKWVSLEGEGNRHPKIRLAHPMTTAKYEGIRKRRRAAVGNYLWAVGDRVDAWMHDGWREGIITGKSQGDDTKLTVNFPDGGATSVICAWNLRPSLVWKDGQWTEWSHPKENSHQPSEGDTPNEKRQKTERAATLVDPEVDGKGVSKLSKNLPIGDSGKSEESRQLVLSAKDKVFAVGKNIKQDDKSDARNIRRIGLQKEGSRVVIGVPKPGKKRKFMEVSKHYVADKTVKTSEGSDSIKFAKYLMPQASRAWRNTPKVDPKGKGVGDSKIRGLKAVKPSMQTRRTSENNSSMTFASTIETGHISLPNARAPFSTEPNNPEKKSLEAGTYASRVGKPGSPHIEPIAQPDLNSSKKKSFSAVAVDLGLRGKFTPVVEKLTRGSESSENVGKAVSDAPEPRRSNRRIQPTSRLLEGLQSSLIISKIPSFSHDKGAKVQHKGASSSRGSAHG